MSGDIQKKIQEAMEKIVADLKSMGFDPYVEVVPKNNKSNINIIIPVEQLVEIIRKRSDTPAVRRYINFEIKEVVVGTKGYIVLRISQKQ